MDGEYFYLDGSFGWLLRNILFAVALPKALRISSDFILAFPCALVLPKVDCSLWSHPLRIGRTQSPLKTSGTDVFAFLHLSAKSSELVSRLCTKKPALFVRAL